MTFFQALVIAGAIQNRPGWMVWRLELLGTRYVVRAGYGPGVVAIDVHEYDLPQLTEQLVRGEARARATHQAASEG